LLSLLKRLPLAACLLASLSSHAELPIDAEPLLRVMLQGSSAAEMRELVEANGGTVTHDLHIINAVGAVLSRAQLDEAIKSPLVIRHIDDLSISEVPEEPEKEEPPCDVDAALELQTSGNEIQWSLYNKKETSARLTRLEFSWPPSLGALKELKLGTDKLLKAAPIKASEDGLILEFKPTDHALVEGLTRLQAGFDKPIVNMEQREFDIRLDFGEDCEAELIPGYSNNHENSYYPTAAGADVLHLNGITGHGVTVAVLDSGLWEHPALKLDTKGENRVIARYDAIKDVEGEEVFDESGHGTHMTSVLAHSEPVTFKGKPTGSFKGMAPDSTLVAVKAFNEEGQGDFLDIVRGLQYVVDNREKYNIKVLNLSFAARPRWHYWLDPINQAVMKAWDAGITVVAAAGNEGPEPMSIGSPGNLPYIITVGAVTDSWTVNDRSDDYIPDFSSRGPTPNAHIKPDIVAPGGHISGVTRPGSTLTKEHPEYLLSTGEFVMTGTSQASALVSGMVALLLQLEPELSPNDVKCKLISSAEPAINADGLLAYSPFAQGHGYASATRAVTLGQTGCGNDEMDITKDLNGGDHYQGPAVIDDEGNISLPGLTEMISPAKPAKGTSETRKWGVKEHLERPNQPATAPSSAPHPFNWEQSYQEERAIIEQLATPE
jgi:serine protease AprX